MIISLGNHSLRDARRAAHRFLERTNGASSLEAAVTRRRNIPEPALKLERARMRIKVRYTHRLRKAILDSLAEMRRALLGSLGLREDDASADDSSAPDAATTTQIADRVTAALEGVSAANLVAELRAIQQDLVAFGMESAAAEIGFAFDLKPQNAIDALYQYTLVFAQNVVDREKVAIKDALLAGIDAGESTAEIAQRIRDTLDDGIHILSDNGVLQSVDGMPVLSRATGEVVRVIPADTWSEMVARTEVARAMQAGVMVTYRAAGVKYVQWIAADDERTCVQCSDLDGEIAPLDGSFSDGTAVGDLAHISCRCTTVSAPAPADNVNAAGD